MSFAYICKQTYTASTHITCRPVTMAEKSVALSARLPAEDATFLSDWQVEGASTQSEKLRKVVKETRTRVNAAEDYTAALRMAQSLLGPALEHVRAAEVETGLHSELVTRVAEWLPELLAYVHSVRATPGGSTEARLRRLEGGLALRVLTLTQSLLQMAVTERGPFYDPELLEGRLQGVLDTARVVEAARASYVKSAPAGSPTSL